MRYMLVKLNDLITKVKEAYETYDFAAVYHAIHNFCTIDLSSFYLDFAKDILYIEGANHADRRAIQTVLYDVLVALTKLVTPILPHTADEVWPYVPGVTEESVQLTNMPEATEVEGSEALKAKWDAFMTLRDDVLKALEVARNEKVIGKSLNASITLYPTAEMKVMLESISEDLKQLFIVSEYKLGGMMEEAPADAPKYEHTAVVVSQATGETCERCWVVSETIGKDAEHETLCERCASVVKENYVK